MFHKCIKKETISLYFKQIVYINKKIDSIEQEIEIEMPRQVFCKRQSMPHSEFFQAGNQGIKASSKFIVNLWDYNNETKVRYNGRIFHVYRTYELADYVELFVEVKTDD